MWWKTLLYQAVCVITAFLMGYVLVRVFSALGVGAFFERLFG